MELVSIPDDSIFPCQASPQLSIQPESLWASSLQDVGTSLEATPRHQLLGKPVPTLRAYWEGSPILCRGGPSSWLLGQSIEPVALGPSVREHSCFSPELCLIPGEPGMPQASPFLSPGPILGCSSATPPTPHSAASEICLSPAWLLLSPLHLLYPLPSPLLGHRLLR